MYSKKHCKIGNNYIREKRMISFDETNQIANNSKQIENVSKNISGNGLDQKKIGEYLKTGIETVAPLVSKTTNVVKDITETKEKIEKLKQEQLKTKAAQEQEEKLKIISKQREDAMNSADAKKWYNNYLKELKKHPDKTAKAGSGFAIIKKQRSFRTN